MDTLSVQGLLRGDQADDDHHHRHHLLARMRESILCRPCFGMISSAKSWMNDLSSTFGSSFLILMCSVYFVQGLRSFAALAENYYFVVDVQVTPAVLQSLKATAHFPWNIKPVYGILSDSIPIFGMHRRPYFIIAAILGLIGWSILAIPVNLGYAAAFFFLLTNASTAIADVIIDALVAANARRSPQSGAGDLQSLCWGSLALAGVIGSGLGGIALQFFPTRACFAITALCPVVLLYLSRGMYDRYDLDQQETRKKIKTGWRLFVAKFRQLFQAVRNKLIWRPALWIFLSQGLLPSTGEIMFFFYTEDPNGPKFSSGFLGGVSVVAYAATFVGVVIYNRYLKVIPLRKVFFFTKICVALATALDIVIVTRANLDIGIPDRAFLLAGEVIGDVIGQIMLMPMLVLASQLCPPGVEGTLFALLMSISNLTGDTSRYIGAICSSLMGINRDNYSKLWVLILIKSIGHIVVLVFLPLVPTGDITTQIAELIIVDDDEEEDDEDHHRTEEHEERREEEEGEIHESSGARDDADDKYH